MALRDYQLEAVKKIESIFENDNRVMLGLPTGAGKTYTFCEVAKRYFLLEVKKVLILVHRKELLEQTFNSLGERCFKIEAGVHKIPNTFDYYVGMVETVYNREKILPDFGLVIIDEAHIGNFNKLGFFEKEDVKILGVSATPTSSNMIPLSELYKNLIEPITINKLIKRGFLVNADCWSFASEDVANNSKKWKLNRNGDYQTRQMSDFYSSSKMVETVIDAYWKHSAGKQTMIFNVNIEHNLEVYKRFTSEGLNVYSVDSTITDKKERDKIIEDFKNDKHGIMCNVGVLTTGFDCPSIETIILNRSTKSLTLFLQMVGRGARPCKEIHKEKFQILDLGNNIQMHGFYSDWRDWSKMFTECKVKGNGVAPIKECPECGYLCHTRVNKCPGCGFVFPKEDDKNERSDALIKLKADDPFTMDLDKFFQLGTERGYKPYYYGYKIAEHLVNYQKRHLDILSTQELILISEVYFDRWMSHIGKRKTQWNRDFLFNAILQEQKKQKILGKLKEYHNEDNKLIDLSR